MNATILVTWPDFDVDGPDVGRRLSAAGHELRLAPGVGRSRDELIALLDGVEAAIVSTDPFDATVLAAARRLRVIARVGVGTDSIDLEAAARHGVAVCTTPGANTESSADHAIALMLAALRRVPEHDRAVRAGAWERTGSATGWELHGATVGLVGCGAIGRAVARRLSGFDARVLVFDPYAGDAPGTERVPLERLLAESDVISLHLPLTSATRGLLDRRRLAQMPARAVLVNTARGGLIDEDALADALERGALRAAALDVLAKEPPGATRLRALPNVVLSPHVAGLSDRSIHEMTRRATDVVLDVLAGREPADRVASA
ncbi:phosphoglycerate dehydrogenase [Solirubrobacter soli]|uniref:phosphoglycerate dehydrogenase n=1 Tax=Solirubrobacter soli TaxID=363832 RepID=UPI0004119C31|nr:phosphoglycerate dehydrogenase [Solirubrobacter soli]